jgi:hypothetical protein
MSVRVRRGRRLKKVTGQLVLMGIAKSSGRPLCTIHPASTFPLQREDLRAPRRFSEIQTAHLQIVALPIVRDLPECVEGQDLGFPDAGSIAIRSIMPGR